MSGKRDNSDGTEAKSAKRGKPEPGDGRVAVRISLDADVIAAFKAEGPDWMDRINEALREAMHLRAGRLDQAEP